MFKVFKDDHLKWFKIARKKIYSVSRQVSEEAEADHSAAMGITRTEAVGTRKLDIRPDTMRSVDRRLPN